MEVPWKFYGAIPSQEGTLAHKRFYSSNEGQFGAAVFEDVLLDFQPDIVLHVRDEWMESWELESPFRKYYKSILSIFSFFISNFKQNMAKYTGSPREKP